MKSKYRRCCGIDVHKKSVTVCILPPVGRPEVEVRLRNFPTFTRDLKELRKWLKNCGIAMESTGQYWRALWRVRRHGCMQARRRRRCGLSSVL